MEFGARLLVSVGLTALFASPALAENPDVMALYAVSSIARVDATGEEPGVVSADGVDVAAPADHAASQSGWQFSVSPYFWMAGLKGDMGVAEEVEPVAVDLSFGDILGALKFAAMGGFEARNGRFVGTADVLYISLGTSDNIEIREVDFIDAKLKSKSFVTTLTAGYRAVDVDRLFVDVLAGGRLNSMKTALDLVGPRRSFSGSKSETWIDPVVGIRVQAPLGKDWSVKAYGDIGGFGVSSDITWQLRGEVQYDLSQRWSLSAGWRHLKTDYENNGFVFDAAMDGPILGAVYRF